MADEMSEQSMEHQAQVHQNRQTELNKFWQAQIDEIHSMNSAEDFKDCKSHQLPLARIKKIMKCDEEVKQMISAEAPVLFAKACELFILDLTKRSWIHTDENRRRTLQRSDIACAITKTDIFDFLIDIVPRDDKNKMKEEQQRAMGGPTAEQLNFYLMQQQQMQMHPGMQHPMMNPAMMYGQYPGGAPQAGATAGAAAGMYPNPQMMQRVPFPQQQVAAQSWEAEQKQKASDSE